MAGGDPVLAHVHLHRLSVVDPRQQAHDPHALAEVLGHQFADGALLDEALTHASVNPGRRGGAQHANERLEFLGDRVLGLVMATWLLELFPQEAEGALAKRYAALVRQEALADVARSISLGDYLRLSRGEDSSGGRDNAAILADACEAVLGALYLDGGLDAARRFVRTHWQSRIRGERAPPRDPKTALQEWAQHHGLPLPEYTEAGRTGPDHAPQYTVRVEVVGQGGATASGSTKRAAEKGAAAELLGRLPPI